MKQHFSTFFFVGSDLLTIFATSFILQSRSRGGWDYIRWQRRLLSALFFGRRKVSQTKSPTEQSNGRCPTGICKQVAVHDIICTRNIVTYSAWASALLLSWWWAMRDASATGWSNRYSNPRFFHVCTQSESSFENRSIPGCWGANKE